MKHRCDPLLPFEKTVEKMRAAGIKSKERLVILSDWFAAGFTCDCMVKTKLKDVLNG